MQEEQCERFDQWAEDNKDESHEASRTAHASGGLGFMGARRIESNFGSRDFAGSAAPDCGCGFGVTVSRRLHCAIKDILSLSNNP
jgi:hypothetical protein